MDNLLLKKINVKKKKNIKKYFKLIRTRSSVDIVIVGTGPKMRRGFETRTKIAIKIYQCKGSHLITLSDSGRSSNLQHFVLCHQRRVKFLKLQLSWV